MTVNIPGGSSRSVPTDNLEEKGLEFNDGQADLARDVVRAGHNAIFVRMGRNVGWLLGGRGFAGVISIAYLPIAARALGPVGFGGFALILAYGGSIAGLAQFNSWQAVIRFGAIHLSRDRPDRLSRLLGFTTILDAASSLGGAVIAASAVVAVGPVLGWSAHQETRAAWFGAALLLSTGSTATGVLRLYDRFDLLTYAETVGPGVRLLGAAIAWWAGVGVEWFLAVWAVAAIAENAAQWIAAFIDARARWAFSRSAFRLVCQENPSIWKFMLQTNLSASLSQLWQQLGTLAVGAAGGPADAGAFRIASKLAGALAKPVETLTRVLYPELAKLAASRQDGTLRQVALRVTLLAATLAAAMILGAWTGGAALLRLLYGRQFQFAEAYLLVLTTAAGIGLCGVALEPIHNAYGFPGRVLAARAIGAAVYILALCILLPTMGAWGAAVAAIVNAAVIVIFLKLSSRSLMRLSAETSLSKHSVEP